MLIGLTGQIGAGKTTAADILKELGATVIDADRIGRQVVNQSSILRKQLAKSFGKDILTPTGRLKRQRLAELAFASETGKKRLNKLVHPYLLKELRRQVKQAKKKAELVVIDAALLLDWKLDREVDFVLVIHASLEDRLIRLKKRGISRVDALARQKAQLPFSEFRKRADRVVLNNGTKVMLKAKIKALYHALFSE